MNDCYRCLYRGSIPGDEHSCCKHPDLNGVTNDQIQAIADKFKIKADYHAIKNGWFNWPSNFDPVWLTNCEGFISKDGEDGTRSRQN
jgi:hypothetical protein